MNEIYTKYRRFGVIRKEQIKKDFPNLSENTLNQKVKDAKKIGILKSIGRRRGLYFIVEPGSNYKEAQPDELLVAMGIAPGAIICFLSALAVKGRSHNLNFVYHISSDKPFKELNYRDVKFRYVTLAYRDMLIEQQPYKSGILRYTCVERTLVDCLRSQRYSGGFENLYQSFKSVEYINTEKVAQYLQRIDSPALNAKTGFFLEIFKKRWKISQVVLNRFRERLPASPEYFWGREKKNGKLVKRWSLIVPKDIIELGDVHAS